MFNNRKKKKIWFRRINIILYLRLISNVNVIYFSEYSQICILTLQFFPKDKFHIEYLVAAEIHFWSSKINIECIIVIVSISWKTNCSRVV